MNSLIGSSVPWLALPQLLALCIAPTFLSSQEEPGRWTLTEEVRIGSLDRENYVLTEVSAVTRGHDGEIFIGQPSYRQVLVYDSSGRYMRSLGRRGRGPGEFEDVDRLGWHDGAIYVLDGRLGRLSLLSPDGDHLDSWASLNADLPAPFMPYPPVAVLADGALLFRPDVSARLQENVERVPLGRLDSAGAL